MKPPVYKQESSAYSYCYAQSPRTHTHCKRALTTSRPMCWRTVDCFQRRIFPIDKATQEAGYLIWSARSLTQTRDFLSIKYRDCAKIALDPAAQRAYLHRLATGRLVRPAGKGTCHSVTGRCSTAVLDVPKCPLLHSSGHDVPTRGCCSVCGNNVARSRAVARCVETVSGVSRRTWLSADRPVLRKANVSGMTENRRAVARMRRMAP